MVNYISIQLTINFLKYAEIINQSNQSKNEQFHLNFIFY